MPQHPNPNPTALFLPVDPAQRHFPEPPPSWALPCSLLAPDPRLPQPSISFRLLAHCATGTHPLNAEPKSLPPLQASSPATHPHRLPSSHRPQDLCTCHTLSWDGFFLSSAPGYITFEGAISAHPINVHTQALFSMTHGTTQPSLWTLLGVSLSGRGTEPLCCMQQCQQTQLPNVKWMLTALQTAQHLDRQHGLPALPRGVEFCNGITFAARKTGLWLRTCTLLSTDPSATESTLWWTAQLCRPAHQPAWPSLHWTNPLLPSPSHTSITALHPTLRRDRVPSGNNSLLPPVTRAGHRPHKALLRGSQQR